MTSAVQVKKEKNQTVESKAKSLFKKGLYLQAKKLCENNWGEIKNWKSFEQLDIASTLYTHLGGDRNADAITVLLYRKSPTKSENIVSQWYYVLNKYGCIIAEEFFDKTKTLVTGDEADEDRLGFDAILQRQFHNFDRSEELLDKALAITKNQTWFNILKTANLLSQEKFDDAYIRSKSLYELEPKISTLRSYFNSTQHFKGLETAIQIYWRELPKFESASLWLDCAASMAELLKWSECEFCLEQYDELKFSDDRWTKHTYNSLKGQLLLAKGEYELGKELLKNCKQFYWETVSKNIDLFTNLASKPIEYQKILDVPFYRQKHLTCAPTSMAAIANYLGRNYESEAIAGEICFDGTPDTKERQWLRDNDFHFVEFELKKDILVQLIDKDVPFSLCTTSGFTSHMQAVIGYNLKYGSMYIMDPSSPAMQEMLIEETIKKEAYLGARCLAFVPIENKQKLDFINTPCSQLYPIYDRYRLAKDAQDINEMQNALDDMKSVAPKHRMTVFAERDQACFYKDFEQIQVGNVKLLTLSPNETILLNSQYFCIRDRGERKEAIEQLSNYLEKNTDRDLTETLFNELSDTNENPSLVTKLLLKIKRTGYRAASIYDSIANYYWYSQEFELAQKFYFIALCMDETNARYAENYFRASNVMGKKEEAIEWLKKRFDKYITRSPSPAISLYQSYCAVNQETKGINALEQALLIHPNDSELISILAKAYADTGKLKELNLLLEEKKECLSRRQYIQLLAKLKQAEGLLSEASDCYKELYITSPFLSEIATPYFRSLNRLGKIKKLDQEIEYLINQNPNAPSVYFYAADWHSKSEYLVEVLNKAIQARPDNWYLRESQINAFIRLNKYSEALQAAKQSQEHFNNGALQTALLAKCFYFNEEFEKAESHAQNVLLKDIDNEIALWVLTVTCLTEDKQLSSLNFVKDQLKLQHSLGNGIWHYWHEGQNILSKANLLDFVNTLLTQYENDWFTYCVAAQYYSHFNQLDNAIEILSKGQNKFPLVPRMYSEQAVIYLANGDINSAINLNEKALNINPSWDTVAKRLADLYEKKGNIESSVKVIQNCLSHNAQNGILHGYCTDYLIKLNRKENALSHIVMAIRFYNDYEWGWKKLVELTDELDKQALVVDLSNELIEQQPHLSASWRFKAFLAKSREDKIDYLKEAINCDPMDESSYAQLADIYTRQGEFKSAIDLYSNTPWGDSLPIRLAKSKAELLANTGEVGKGAELLWGLLRNQSDYVQVWQKLYDMYAQLIEKNEAYKAKIIEAAERQIELNPHEADALCVAAEQLLIYGDSNKATDTLKRAYELAPSDEYIMLTYVDRLIELEKYDVALICLLDYEQFDSVNFALARKVNVLTQLKDEGAALDAYKKLIANQCDIYGTINHAHNALSKIMDANILLNLLGAQLDTCTKIQANLWADKFIELAGKNPIRKLLAEMETISSLNGWSGTFTGLLDYWQDKGQVPDISIVNKYITKIQQDNDLIARLVDINVQAGNYYNAVHIFDSVVNRTNMSMAVFYQYAICLLMLGRGNQAGSIITEGLNAEPDHTLHNLLVWSHADKWMHTKDINLEELGYIDKSELIEAEAYILKALELMGRLDEKIDFDFIRVDLMKLRKSYRVVEGLATCDSFHHNCVKTIKSIVKPNSFWQKIQMAMIVR